MRSLTFFALSMVLCQVNLLAKSEILIPVTPTLSPDGSKFAFSWHDDIWLSDITGGEAQRITNHPSQEIYPIFSPDGNTLFFNSNRSGSLQIWKLDLQKRGKPIQITQHSDPTYIEDITNDQKNIITRASRERSGLNASRFYFQDIKGELAEKMIFDAYGDDARISPDGSKILFSRESAGTYRKEYVGSQAPQIWLYDLNDKTFSQPVANDHGVHSPMWKADSSGFFYVNAISGTSNLHSYTFSNKEDKSLTNYSDDGIIAPVISKDGSTILFRNLFNYYSFSTSSDQPPKKIDLFHTEDLEILREKDIKISSTKDADFSDSGLEIAFTANGDIYAMDTVLREPNQLTNTFTQETNIVFSKDGKTIFFIEDDGITTRLCLLKKKTSSKYWWEAKEFTREVLVDTKETISGFAVSPDNKSVAYTTTEGRLWITNIKNKKSRVLTSSWDSPSFEWSPDSEWITYAVSNDNFNSDVFIVRADGSEPAVNISQHPDNDFAPTFSPDGKKIAFIGRRFGSSYDLYFVDLTTLGSGKSARSKKLESARKAMKNDPIYKKKTTKPKKTEPPVPADPKSPKLKTEPDTPKKADPNTPDPKKTDPNAQPDPKQIPKADPKKQQDPPAEPPSDDEPKKEEPTTPELEQPKEEKSEKDSPDEKKNPYDFDNVQKRIERIRMRYGNPSSILWSQDSKSIIFSTSSSKSTYVVEAKEGANAKEWLKAKVSSIRMADDGKLYCISEGAPAFVKSSRVTKYPFNIYATQTRIDYQRTVFRHIWRTMRDGFYDEHLNGKNWPGMLTKYEHAAATAPSMKAFDRVIAMLLGELNASHTGFRSQPWQPQWVKKVAYRKEVAHLGALFDQDHKGKGWKVKEILPAGPADQARSKLEVGDVILEINGVEVTPQTPQTEVLLGRITDEINLKAKGANNETKTVNILPISFTQARSLYEESEIEKTSQHIEKISSGRLGYIHIARMMWDEFEQFERHLYENGAGKDGIVIDVRNNGGGFTTDHLLTVLTQPRHAYTIPRNGGPGYPQDRFVYATWDKPIVVLCNQNSFSNAEIFSHAIKSLKRGKLVGVPTAGGVISAGQVNILGAGNLRYPFRGWFIIGSGQDMELNGAQPDHILWPLPGELPNGIDRQADKAVETLLEEIKNTPRQFPKPLYHNRQPKADISQ